MLSAPALNHMDVGAITTGNLDEVAMTADLNVVDGVKLGAR